jgi:NADH-quinone oxidoreductase subunit L
MVSFASLTLYSWLVPAFPMLGFLGIITFGKHMKKSLAGVLGSLMVLLSFVYVVFLFFGLHQSEASSLTVRYFTWMAAGRLSIPFEFLVDPLSVTMMLIVSGVGLLIHVYSIGYMHDDENYSTFFAYMNLFIFFMLLLVMSANYLFLFIGWEGVGLCSYLLIGFWFKNHEFNNAARKAFIMNRIGDLGLLLGIIIILTTFKTLNFGEVFSQLKFFPANNNLIVLITLLLLVGAVGKSAQIPLYTWLPDAMAGPTPVSALIHAATMVTAGIYMIARSSVLFNLAPFTLDVIIVISIATALLAASIGLFQNDIKKVLAYSTVSQLGYMFLALGLGAYSSSIFHLTTHAFFKALLFLGAGSVIHSLSGEQDIRKMGGLRKSLPITYITFLIGTLAISGIPPFSGFFSKDEILSKAFSHNYFLYTLSIFAALLTCFYMFRLLYLVFHGKNRGTVQGEHPIHESPKVMTIPLMILAILSFAGGFINIPAIFGGHAGFEAFLSPSLAETKAGETTTPFFTELTLILFSLLLLGACIYFAWRMFVKQADDLDMEEPSGPSLKNLIFNKYYVDETYNLLFVRPFEWLSAKVFSPAEKIFNASVVNGVGRLTLEIGNQARRLQTGNISFYVFVMIAGVLFFLLMNLFNA